ncbi:GntR family transcriptional regulator [Niallia sp.]|uniref:GntR family transcriptional regulator n=1 Tax=Niallia sp. TaxID=2837523 RepID=UPI0028986FE8|nr:GntR family transcriptional regulator [Niallia sp.]
MAQTTKYNMVKEKITDWIINGKVQPGEKIYSENELGRMFGVSRHTIRQAIGDLVHEGWLYREQGAGTFVSHQQAHSSQTILSHPPLKRTKNIGVITTYISDYIFPSIIKGIESYLTDHGYSLTFACTDNDIKKEKQCLQTMLDRNIDGLIIEPTKTNTFNPNMQLYLELEQNKIPYLMINQFYSQLSPPHLVVDDELGGFISTEHLIKLGHKKIIGLFKSDDLQGINRMKGFIQAYKAYSIPFFPEMLINYSTENQAAYPVERLAEVFETTNKPTAIVCYNDQLAIQVIHYLRSLNLSIPEDISIIGYDDSFLTEASEVKLTSVSHPKKEMGMEAAKWIVDAVEKKGTLPPSFVYKPKLVLRTSTGPCPHIL